MKIIIDDTVPKEFLEFLVVKHFPGIITEFQQLEKQHSRFYTSDFILGTTTINIHLSEDDINKVSEVNEDYKRLLLSLSVVLNPYYKISNHLKEKPTDVERDHNPLFVFYLATDGNVLQFIMNKYDSDQFANSMTELSQVVIKYENKSDIHLNDELSILHIQDDKKIYFENQSGNWKLIKPLNEIADEISKDFYAKRDKRSKKPDVLIDSNNLNKKMNVGNNWVLNFESKDLMMSKPNDVSLYCNISTRSANDAKELLSSMKGTMKGLIINFPSEAEQTMMFNYFELVIQAVIFSYSSIEAFVNITIPSYYTYTDETDGVATTYNKDAIERKFQLREKLKKILKDILVIPVVTSQPWWNDFILLEDIRNEFIHSKESTAEERYNKLLDPSIFKLINVNQELLKYYGDVILKTKPDLINEFPIGYGFDLTWPGLATSEGFESSRRVVMNIPNDQEEE